MHVVKIEKDVATFKYLCCSRVQKGRGADKACGRGLCVGGGLMLWAG